MYLAWSRWVSEVAVEGGPPASPLPQSLCSAKGEARLERCFQSRVGLSLFIFTSLPSVVLRFTVSLALPDIKENVTNKLDAFMTFLLLCSFQIFLSFTAVLCVLHIHSRGQKITNFESVFPLYLLMRFPRIDFRPSGFCSKQYPLRWLWPQTIRLL